MRFSAEVHAAGRGGRAVVVPAEVTAALSSRKVAVRALVNGVEHRSRLAVHAGRTYLGLPAALLRRLGVAPGDTVVVELEEQPEPEVAPEPESEVAEPAELTAVLSDDPAVQAAWSALSTAQRQEYHRWVAGAEEPAVRAARAARLRHRLLRQG
nr:YdeI/OmpD-associated family protein [uncultured Friedmanniella sp.]